MTGGRSDPDGQYRFQDDPNTLDTGVATYWYPVVVDIGAYEYGSGANVPGPCFGDLHCNGSVDFKEINPFVLYLSNFSAWRVAHPGCPAGNGDTNDDGSYPTLQDINPLEALLSGA